MFYYEIQWLFKSVLNIGPVTRDQVRSPQIKNGIPLQL